MLYKKNMNLIGLIVFGLSATECLARIITQPSKTDDLTSLVEATIEIVSRCFENEVNTVGVAGISNDFLVEKLCSQQSLPVALIGNDSQREPMDSESRYKLQLFVVSASSSKQLEMTLGQIKNSLWWNHMADVLILDWQSTRTEQECSNAFEFLWSAWKMNLLKATYLCLHPTRGRLIYTYNPYANKAPRPWHYEKTYKGKNDHPWTVFFRKYEGDQRICENLVFDKTNDLTDYPIRGTVKQLPPVILLDLNKTGIESISGFTGNPLKAIFHGLKTIADLKILDHKQSPGFSDLNGIDIAMDTVTGSTDILLVPRLFEGVPTITVSYLFSRMAFNIVTQNRGHQSQLQKILTVLDSSTRIGLCLVALTVLIFFKFFRQEALIPAVLNTLRIIANSSLTKVPKNDGARIFLTGVFFLVVTIVGIYQGLLASLLTKSKPLKNVESLEDLAESGYTIHAYKAYDDVFMNPPFKGRFIEHDDHLCLDSVAVDSLAACVASKLFIFNDAVKRKLHIAREEVFSSAVGYVIRKDWPLEERFKKVVEALTEAYVIEYELFKDVQPIVQIKTFNDDQDKIQKFEVMTLSDLTFAFVLLGIGLACATVCFIVEVAIQKRRLRIQNVDDNIQNRVRFKTVAGTRSVYRSGGP